MARFRAFRSRAGQVVRDSPRAARDLGEQIANPERLERFRAKASLGGQVTAFFVVPVIVILSFALVQALNETMTSIFGGYDAVDRQTPIFGFLVTGITLGAFVFSAWLWFQFVRTAGFGVFQWD